MPVGSGSCGLLNALQRPDDDVLALGQVAERIALELGPVGLHGVERELDLGRTQLPRRVVDLGAVEAALVTRVKAVALREKVLETPPLGRGTRTHRAPGE